MALLCLLALAGAIYSLGFSGSMWYDDAPNLNGLSSVINAESAIDFIATPQAGPLGRPVALASFILNAPSWPHHITDFLYTNTCIHLLNGLLVIWFSYKLARRLPQHVSRHHELFALATGALWLCHPLLLSASLMTVQRMTTLCATFMLLGLILFLSGHEKISSHPAKAFWRMSIGIAGGTLLAALTKENGMLLPLYALILESTLLYSSTNNQPAWYRGWRYLFLVIPPLLLLFYFAINWNTLILSGYELRDFSVTERLLTQFRVLFDYITLTIAPIRSQLGPIHDDYAVSHGIFDPPTTLAYVALWAAILIIAIASRKKYPPLAFAIFWFLAGHSIESSAIPLEMYFEHRNYTPALGPLLLLVFTAWRWIEHYRKTIVFALSFYFLLYLFVLHESAEVWGKPLLAAELWHEQHPSSERAAQYLSNQYTYNHRPHKAYEVIAEASRHNPNKLGLALQRVQLKCGLGNERSTLPWFTPDQIQHGEIKTVVCSAIKPIAINVAAGECGEISASDVHALADTLLAHHQLKKIPSVGYCLHETKSFLYEKERYLSGAVEELEKGFNLYPQLEDAIKMAAMLASAGLYDEALDKLDYAMTKKPENTFSAEQWDRLIYNAKNQILTWKNDQATNQ